MEDKAEMIVIALMCAACLALWLARDILAAAFAA